ncbi:hypothetical protein D3C81_1871470 [compost metagenome]
MDVVLERVLGVVQPEALLQLRHQRRAGFLVHGAVGTGDAEGVVHRVDHAGVDVHAHRRQEPARLHHRSRHNIPAALRLVRIRADVHHVRAQVQAARLHL